MAKINISFYDVNYSIEESSLAEAVDEFQNHLSTTMSGSGSVINFGGTAYNVDSAKLSSATSDFIVHLGNIAGNGLKVTIDGVEYPFDPTKVSDTVSNLTTALEKLVVSEVVEVLLSEYTVESWDYVDAPALKEGKTYTVVLDGVEYPNLVGTFCDEDVQEDEETGELVVTPCVIIEIPRKIRIECYNDSDEWRIVFLDDLDDHETAVISVFTVL